MLDTHAAIWWSTGSSSLSVAASTAIEAADEVGIPSIVFWETALLVRKKRLEFDLPVREWATNLATLSRVRVWPLEWKTALLADDLQMHADPADRFIVAEALRQDASVITRDELIRAAGLVRTIW